MDIVILAILSAFVFYRLWTVLGTKTGHEKKQQWHTKDAETSHDNNDNIIVLPNRKNATVSAVIDVTEAHDRPFDGVLASLKEHDPEFNEDVFIRGAERAFDIIVCAYARGDRSRLKTLLSKEMYAKFDQAITLRSDKKHTMEAEIESIDAKIIDAVSTKASTTLVVQFESEQMLATFNEDGISLDNPARLTTRVVDVWTFKRMHASSSKAWILIKTESK